MRIRSSSAVAHNLIIGRSSSRTWPSCDRSTITQSTWIRSTKKTISNGWDSGRSAKMTKLLRQVVEEASVLARSKVCCECYRYDITTSSTFPRRVIRILNENLIIQSPRSEISPLSVCKHWNCYRPLKSFRLSKRSSALGISKTSESPPPMRKDLWNYSVEEPNKYTSYNPHFRSSVQPFDRNSVSTQSVNELSFGNRNNAYRRTVQMGALRKNTLEPSGFTTPTLRNRYRTSESLRRVHQIPHMFSSWPNNIS